MATCKFTDQLSSSLAAVSPDGDDRQPTHDHGEFGHTHDHSGGLGVHSHDNASGTWTPLDHGHTHEHLEHAGTLRLASGCAYLLTRSLDTREICREGPGWLTIRDAPGGPPAFLSSTDVLPHLC